MIDTTPDVLAIFSEAVTLSADPDRANFLDQACGDNVELRRRLEELLRAHREAGGFLGGDATALIADGPPLAEQPGAVIGPYKLLEQIGEGGFGVVFLAEQEHSVRRKVALKIIKPGMDTRQVIARFEAERQALAMMDHPNIAKVHDAGTTENGRPYFVMELVQGVPITDFCDQCHLTTHERLKLFITVCQAVQHAHQKGIIHRDLKPTNILVAMQDGRPAPKIIDFGVAKALNQRLTEHTLATGHAQMIGTPLYMSPEQAELSSLGADTRSDIYSLGVLLYELLTGTTPFDKDRLHSAGYDEMRRIIREEEPPRPSARLSTLAADLATTVDGRGPSDLRRLGQTVCGELDWIVMKCLEKDRSRRYETASDLCRDIERYLLDEPVEARPPSATYRLGKFMRRNRASLLTAAGVLLTVIVGLATSSFLIAQERDAARAAAERERVSAEQARAQAVLAKELENRAERERDRAETNLRKAREAVDRFFTTAATNMADQPHMEHIRRALLEDALAFYQGFLEQKSDDPSVRFETAQAYSRVARINMLLGQLQRAEQPLRKAIDLSQQLTGEFPAVPEYRAHLAACHGQLSELFAPHYLNRVLQSRDHVQAALSIQRQLVADFPNRPHFRHNVAWNLTSLGLRYTDGHHDVEVGEKYLREAVAAWEELRTESPDDPAVALGFAHARHWLGSALLATHRFPEAEMELRQALSVREDLLAANPKDMHLRQTVEQNKDYLAKVLRQTGRGPDAIQLIRSAIAIREDLRDEAPHTYEHWRRIGTLQSELAECLFAMGSLEEAELALRLRLQHHEKTAEVFPEAEVDSRNSGWTHYNLGLLLHAAGREQEAVDIFRQALVSFEMHAEQDFAADPEALHPLAWFLVTCPAPQFLDPQRALELSKRTLQHLPKDADSWTALAIAQYRLEDWDVAVESLEAALRGSSGGSPLQWFLLAMTHFKRGDQDEARKWYDRARAVMVQHQVKHPELLRLQAQATEVLGLAEPNRSTRPPPADSGIPTRKEQSDE